MKMRHIAIVCVLIALGLAGWVYWDHARYCGQVRLSAAAGTGGCAAGLWSARGSVEACGCRP